MSVEKGSQGKGSHSGLRLHPSASLCVELPGKAEGIILTETAAHFLRGSFPIVNVHNMSSAVLYKVKTNAPSKFKVRPLLGYILPSGNATVSVQSSLNSTDPRLVISRNDKFLILAMPLPENDLNRILLQLEQKKNIICSDSSSGRDIRKQFSIEQHSLLTQLWTENEAVDGASTNTEKHIIGILINGNHNHLDGGSKTATEIITKSVAPMIADQNTDGSTSISIIRKPLLSVNSDSEIQALISKTKALSANIESKNKLIEDIKSQLHYLRKRMGQFSWTVADGSSSVLVTSPFKSSSLSSTISGASATGTGTGDVVKKCKGENLIPKLESAQTSSTAEFTNDIKVVTLNSNELVVAESVSLEAKAKVTVTVEELLAGNLGQHGNNGAGVVSINAESDGVSIKSGLDFKDEEESDDEEPANQGVTNEKKKTSKHRHHRKRKSSSSSSSIEESGGLSRNGPGNRSRGSDEDESEEQFLILRKPNKEPKKSHNDEKNKKSRKRSRSRTTSEKDRNEHPSDKHGKWERKECKS